LRSIQEALASQSKLFEKYQKSYGEQVEKVLKHSAVKQLKEELSLTDEQIYHSIAEIRHWLIEQQHCNSCPGLEHCNNIYRGHYSSPKCEEGKLYFEWQPCNLHQNYIREERQKRLLRSHLIPNEVLKVTFKNMEKDEGNSEAVRAALLFCRQFPNTKGKGLYFYGEFGVGKTYLMGAIASQLAEQGHSVYFVHAPTFFREIKQSLSDQSFMEKIHELENTDCLILDDIGAENFSPWLRDEVLGPLVQYRTQHEKPTLYTSNLDYDGLRMHLAESSRNQIDELKAFRIAERIRSYTDAYRMYGPNRRRNN